MIKVKCLACQQTFVGDRNFYYDVCPNCNARQGFHFFEIELPFGYSDYEVGENDY